MTPDWLERAYREGRVLSDTGPARLPGPEAPTGGTEDAFQDAVAEFARSRGWKVFHAAKGRTKKGWRTPVRYDGKGFPDLVLAKPRKGRRRGVLILAELKSEIGTRSDSQDDWAQVLSQIGGAVRYFLWRPSDWASIYAILSSDKAV